MADVERFRASCRVMVLIEVYVEPAWGEDWKVADAFKQMKEDAIGKIRNGQCRLDGISSKVLSVEPTMVIVPQK